MAKFKVKVIEHLLKNNKIAKAGDIVDEANLINYEHSVKGGFVEAVDGDDDEDIETDEEREERKAQEKIDEITKEAMDLKKPELIEFAILNGMDFNEEDNKPKIQEDVKSQITVDSIFEEEQE